MRRALLISLLILGGSPAAAAHAASVKLLACVPALDAQSRSATFEARVRQAHGSERMQVRFTLQTREDALSAWRRVIAPGLDQWITSDPGVSRYSYAKTVVNLAAPAAYRMVVRFRRLDADGEVLTRTREVSRACRQPDMRPDLEAERIEFLPALQPERRRYVVTVRNGGRTAAGAFDVALQIGDEPPAELTVAGLAPGERRSLLFAGPACAEGAPPVVTVDAAQVVDERDEDDNVLVALCSGPDPAARWTNFGHVTSRHPR
jgi:hypothetical protein